MSLFAVRLYTAGGLWTALCVWLQWDYVVLADCELNYVCDWGEVEMNLPRETRYWWQVRGINFALNYLQILILKFDYSYYIDILLFLIVSQSHYKVCYYSGFKRIFYRMVINDNFRVHNNKIASYSKYYNSKFNKRFNNSTQVPIPPAVWLTCSLTSLMYLGFCIWSSLLKIIFSLCFTGHYSL